MIHPPHLLKLVIQPVIEGLDIDHKNQKGAEALMLYTAQQKSDCGRYLTQIGGGPARSPWQIEEFTYNDRIDNYLIYRQDLLDKFLWVSGVSKIPDFRYVAGNMYLACAMARIVYRKSKLPIPRWDDLDAMWEIYKSCYNSHLGAAEQNEFYHNCEQVIKYL